MKFNITSVSSLIIILLFLSLNTFAQQIPTINLLIKDGLSSNYVTDITQDRYGFIWFSTRYGLNRYNGNTFTTYYKTNNANSINSNSISKVAADTINNRVWIGTSWDGINYFDCETETFHSFKHNHNDKHSLISNIISDIHITANGNVWIATDKGLDLYDPTKNGFIHINSHTISNFPNQAVTAITSSANGYIYVGFEHGAIKRFLMNSPENIETITFTHPKGISIRSSINCITIEKDTRIWIGSNDGLYLLNPYTEQIFSFKQIPGIHSTLTGVDNSILNSSNGQIWIGTYSDLCYLKTDDIESILSGKKTVNHMFIKDYQWGIQNPSVYAIYEDKFKNIWIGSNGGGASFIANQLPFFKSWRINKIPGIANELNDKEIMTITVDSKNNLWLGTDGGGINVKRESSNEFIYLTRQNTELNENTFPSSLKDTDGNMWWGGYQSLYIYDTTNKHFTQFDSELPIPFQTRCIFEDKQRNIWIASNKGIETFNLDTKKHSVIHPNNSDLPTCNIETLSQDKYGHIWIGTLNKGIWIYNPETKELKPLKNIPIENYNIHQIYNDSRNRMWVATTDGLIMYEGSTSPECIVYNTKDGLSCQHICAIIEDMDGNIWFSTYIGISCYLNKEKRFINYDFNDGALYGNYMNKSVARTEDGTIYFGCINGVCYFHPKDRISKTELPHVVFTDFRIHGKRIENNEFSLPVSQKKIQLRHDQDIFTVTFNVMNKAVQGQVEYAYQMVGLNDSWIDIGTENKVTFRNIAHGNYKLRIKARFKNQDWQKDYSEMLIIIIPPVWLTPLAKTGYFAIIFIIAFTLISSYIKKLRLKDSLMLERIHAKKQNELNEERLRFYTNITHELRTPLTLILGPLEDLQTDKSINELQLRKISLIYKSATRLLNLVTQILEFRKTETQNRNLCVSKGKISTCIHEVVLKYQEFTKNKDIELKLDIETQDVEILYDYEVIYMILDNLLSNAFKYTNNGTIKVCLRNLSINNNDYIEIEVSDTGIGIDSKEIDRIFDRYFQSEGRNKASGVGVGLALVKNLVKLHEGNIFVNSEPNICSIFTIRLLSNNSYPNAIHANQPRIEQKDNKKEKPIVLIIEDDDDIRNYVAESLLDSYEVIVANNGEQGLVIAENTIPDIIICDILMPIMDGIELCRKIKDSINCSHIPIILLTAKDSIQDKAVGYEAGADSYITKPFSASMLKSRIYNLLDSRKKIALSFSSSKVLKHEVMIDSLNKKDNEFIQSFINVIEKNLMDEKMDVTYIAQELSMSYSSLYRKIKAVTGMAIGEFIRKVKIHKAEKLLLSGNYNISEISNMIGFNSTSYFRECFKEEFGTTPSEYIKSIKQN